jgi:teichoic acid transport system permease protein
MSTMDAMDRQYAQRLEAGEAEQLASELGLHEIGARPRLWPYLKALWSRRQFIATMASASAYARNRDNYLGQVWNVLNPLLWAAVYFLVFGLILGTQRDVENFLAFLIIGVFLFRFIGQSFSAGAKAINGNVSLVRSLHFPRAVLPIAGALTEFIILLPALGVMFLIVSVSGPFYGVSSTPTWSWLLAIPAIALLLMFSTGCSLLIARLVADVRDLSNLLPFITRILFYLSGVLYSIERRFGDELGALLPYAEHQPVAIYLSLVRQATMPEFAIDGRMWLFGVGYAVLFLVGGFLFFWRAEERYGRD